MSNLRIQLVRHLAEVQHAAEGQASYRILAQSAFDFIKERVANDPTLLVELLDNVQVIKGTQFSKNYVRYNLHFCTPEYFASLGLAEPDTSQEGMRTVSQFDVGSIPKIDLVPAVDAYESHLSTPVRRIYVHKYHDGREQRDVLCRIEGCEGIARVQMAYAPDVGRNWMRCDKCGDEWV